MDILSNSPWEADSPCLYCHEDPNTCAQYSMFRKESRNFLIITMNVTDKCNESCSHCWHKVMLNSLGEVRRDLEKEDIDVLWEFLDNSIYKDYSIIYSFIGGEPTLRPDIIDYAIQKSLESRGRVSSRIYTNAVSGLDEMRYLKAKHRNLKLQVSLPVNSSESILAQRIENIKRYIRMQTYIDICFSIVIDDGNIDDMIDIIDRCKASGIQEMSMVYDLRDVPVKDPEVTYNKLVNIYRHCKSIMDDNFIVDELFGGMPDTLFEGFNPNNFLVNYDSTRKFYLSHFVKSIPIGDVTNGIDMDKIRSVYNQSPCIGCEYMKLCKIKYIPAFINSDLSTHKYDATCLTNRALYTVLSE